MLACTRLQPFALCIVCAFALVEFRGPPLECAFTLAELTFLRKKLGCARFEVGLAAPEQFFGVGAVSVVWDWSLSTKRESTVPDALLRLFLLELGLSAFDLQLACGDLGCAFAQRSLEIFELGEIPGSLLRALLRELAGEQEHFLAVRVGRNVPVVALPRILVRLHLQGI